MPDAPPNAGAFSNLVTSLTNIGRLLASLQQTVSKVFPQALGTVAQGYAGTAPALPAAPDGYMTVVNPATGGTVVLAFYRVAP